MTGRMGRIYMDTGGTGQMPQIPWSAIKGLATLNQQTHNTASPSRGQKTIQVVIVVL